MILPPLYFFSFPHQTTPLTGCRLSRCSLAACHYYCTKPPFQKGWRCQEFNGEVSYPVRVHTRILMPPNQSYQGNEVVQRMDAHDDIQVPKCLIDIAVSDPDKLDELEAEAEG